MLTRPSGHKFVGSYSKRPVRGSNLWGNKPWRRDRTPRFPQRMIKWTKSARISQKDGGRNLQFPRQNFPRNNQFQGYTIFRCSVVNFRCRQNYTNQPIKRCLGNWIGIKISTQNTKFKVEYFHKIYFSQNYIKLKANKIG